MLASSLCPLKTAWVKRIGPVSSSTLRSDKMVVGSGSAQYGGMEETNTERSGLMAHRERTSSLTYGLTESRIATFTTPVGSPCASTPNISFPRRLDSLAIAALSRIYVPTATNSTGSTVEANASALSAPARRRGGTPSEIENASWHAGRNANANGARSLFMNHAHVSFAGRSSLQSTLDLCERGNIAPTQEKKTWSPTRRIAIASTNDSAATDLGDSDVEASGWRRRMGC